MRRKHAANNALNEKGGKERSFMLNKEGQQAASKGDPRQSRETLHKKAAEARLHPGRKKTARKEGIQRGSALEVADM